MKPLSESGGDGYSRGVGGESTEHPRLLLIDTCGQGAAVALSRGPAIVRSEEFAERSASARLIGAIREMLEAEGWNLAGLDGVGVASGPGSFTGVRVGLAAAKGMCEATGLPMAAVSRLAILAEAAKLKAGFAVLDAGGSALYVRELHADSEAREYPATIAEFAERARGSTIIVAEEKIAKLLAELEPRLRPLRVMDLLGPARRCLAEGGTDVLWADANYVRAEDDIYTRPHAKRAKAAATS